MGSPTRREEEEKKKKKERRKGKAQPSRCWANGPEK
jgi:hypothetical protein